MTLSKQMFADPSAHYRPMPFWFWNSKLRAAEIEYQIREFHEQGLGGFFVHGRFGLETDYLSDEWLDLVEYALNTAAALGMEVWLYDENGFPSGVGNLKVSRIRQFRPKFAKLEDDGTCVFEILEDPNDVVFGIDYLNPDAVKAFFDLTLGTYEKALGKHFGKTLKGIFTDEPTLLPWHHDINWYGQLRHTRVVVWNERIEKRLREFLGMSPEEVLVHLFRDVDELSGEVRRVFWEVVAELYVDTFFKPYAEWCEKRGLKLTGHVLFEEGLYLNTLFQADFPQVVSRLHIPGTDHLGDVLETPYGGFENTPRHLTNVQGQKLVSSVAHLMGREAVLSETYGCAGWKLSFEKMKRILDWQYSLGVNFLCPHACFYSIEGFRKWDAPPSHNHMTGWKFYRRFADYVGRLSYLLRQGKHVARIALYYPMREFRECYRVGSEGETDRRISDTFDLCASELLRLHFDYDIIPEWFLAQAIVQDGRLQIGDECYDVLIAPESVLQTSAGSTVRVFEEQGGRWIQPPLVAGESSRAVIGRYLADSLGSAAIRDVEISSKSARDIRYIHREHEGKHIFFFANTSESAVEAELSLQVVGQPEIWDAETGEVSVCRTARVENGRLLISHLFPPCGSAVFVVDTDRTFEETAGVEVLPKRTEIAVLTDEWHFEAKDLNALPLLKFSLDIHPECGGTTYTYSTSFRCEAIPDKLFLMLDDVEYRNSLMGGMDLTVAVNGTQWHKPQFSWLLDRGFKTLDIRPAVCLGENTLIITIRHCAWSGQPHVLTAPPALLGGFACDPETAALLAPVSTAAAGSWTDFGYPFYSGTASYMQVFDLPELPAGMRVFVSIEDVKDMVEIVVNGVTAALRLWRPWEADITDMLKPGSNELVLRITNSRANFFEATPHPSGLMGRVRLVGCT
ncbi:MAG: glycosyl hydrolase [Armatimonadota bacterium]|nr:glycosyl hydrolase [Armatimonadota bacterium]